MNSSTEKQAPHRVGFVSLGCPKATVDSEHILTQLRAEGYDIVPRYNDADLVVVNTCGFIDNAKEEFLKFSVKAQKHLSKAIAEMKKAFSALNVRDMDKALKHQLKALEELDSLGDTINESMRKQKNLSASKKRGLSGPKTFGSPSVGAGGAGGLNKSGVKLPKEGAYRSSREIREKVMESLKEKYPKKSKETIVDYLRKISQ